MYNSFNLLKNLYFVRTSGSEEETKAATMLYQEALKLGADDSTVEHFEVDGYEIKKAKLNFIDPDIEVECAGVGMSGSTIEDGITCPFIYVTSLEDAKVQDVKGAICLVHAKLCYYDVYKYLAENGAKGIILCTGSVYKDSNEVDLDPYMYRERHYKNGTIPAVCIRMKDADMIVKKMPKKAHLTIIQDEFVHDSHNVVATINGTSNSKDVICFTAHYDSVSFSKGAYDNGTGSTAIMQLLSYFVEHKPKRTLKFIWCGSEECGLLGSKAYTTYHVDELEDYRLNINIDMIGVALGVDIAKVTASQSLVDYLKYDSQIDGFGLKVTQGVYSSDSTPFADHNVPAISFARLSPAGGSEIHSHNDVIDFLDEKNYFKTCEYIYRFAERLVNSKVFPIEKSIPQNVKDEISKYYGKD